MKEYVLKSKVKGLDAYFDRLFGRGSLARFSPAILPEM